MRAEIKVIRSSNDCSLSELEAGEWAVDREGNVYCCIYVPGLAQAQPLNLSVPDRKSALDESIEVTRLRKTDIVEISLVEDFSD